MPSEMYMFFSHCQHHQQVAQPRLPMMDAERRQSARSLTNFAKTSRYCLGEMTAAVVLWWYHDRTCRYNDVLNVAKSACAALSSM